MYGTVQQCYEVRKLPPFKLISGNANSQNHENLVSLRHNIVELGEHVKSVKTILCAVAELPRVLDSFEIQAIAPSSFGPFLFSLIHST